ncbi:hypothetical protein [Georgenia sp. Marseille-Q6866]
MTRFAAPDLAAAVLQRFGSAVRAQTDGTAVVIVRTDGFTVHASIDDGVARVSFAGTGVLVGEDLGGGVEPVAEVVQAVLEGRVMLRVAMPRDGRPALLVGCRVWGDWGHYVTGSDVDALEVCLDGDATQEE